MKQIIKKMAPMALTIAGILGVGITSAITAKCVKKTYSIKENKKLKETWKNYIPAAVAGTVTIGCIVAGKTLDMKEIAALTSVAGASGKLLTEYKDKIRNRFGQEGLDDIHRDIAHDHEDGIQVADVSGVTIYTPVYGITSNEDRLSPECNDLFYDEFTNIWFWSNMANVRAAEYYVNRNHTMNLFTTLADFYQFLGVDIDRRFANTYGWGEEYIASTDSCWIDFEHVESETESGIKYTIISYTYNPDKLGENEIGEEYND